MLMLNKNEISDEKRLMKNETTAETQRTKRSNNHNLDKCCISIKLGKVSEVYVISRGMFDLIRDLNNRTKQQQI